MAGKLTPKVILEGTRLTFKTEIAFALNRHPRFVGPRNYEYHSPIISGEWCAFTNFPWGRGMINFNPEEKAKALETYQTWLKLLKLQKYYSWIIDRWHLSTRAFQLQTHHDHIDFSWLEEGLNELGFQLVFLYRNPESFTTARERRLKVSGNKSQYDNLDVFVKEQELMQQLVDASTLPSIKIDISDNDIDRAVERIIDYMYEIGGMWMAD